MRTGLSRKERGLGKDTVSKGLRGFQIWKDS